MTFSLSAVKREAQTRSLEVRHAQIAACIGRPQRRRQVGQVHRVLRELQVRIANIDRLRQRRRLQRRILQRPLPLNFIASVFLIGPVA